MKKILACLAPMMVCSLILFADVVDLTKTRINTYMKNKSVPGVSAALVVGNNSYILHFGYANLKKNQKVSDQTLFELGSLGKNFVATLLAYRVLNNQMHLDDTLEKYFPYLQINPSNLCQLTLQELATHTSGLPQYPTLASASITQISLLESLQYWQPKYPIGTTYLYSNLGFHLLCFALESSANTDYNSLVSSVLLNPLMMNSTFHCVPQNQFSAIAQGYDANGVAVEWTNGCDIPASGAYHSTSADMMKFLRANLKQLGNPPLISAMLFSHQGFFKVSDFMTQALSWQRITLNGYLTIDKSGQTNGFSTWIGFMPKLNIGLVLLTNKGSNSLTRFARSLLSDITDILPQLKPMAKFQLNKCDR